MIKNIAIILFILSTIQLIGQNQFLLSGTVIDKDSDEALPFSTVVYQNKMIGTISDIDGGFTLSILDASEIDSLFISFVGYKTIGITISEFEQNGTYRLERSVNQIEEVVVKGKKFKLKSFVRKVIANYNSNREWEPHIATAHYREKAKVDNRYIMFIESIGYSIFSGDKANAVPLSNYKFFCENTKCHVVNPQWVKYKEYRTSFNSENVSLSGGSNLNIFRYMEISGLLSNKHVNRYSCKMDSTYFIGDNLVYSIHFSGDIAKGRMDVFADTKQIHEIAFSTGKYWSNAFHKRVDAEVNVQFNYFNDTPFISSIDASYKHKELEYTNTLTILVQKFNDFRLNESEYWSLNLYDSNPYIEYLPEAWELYNIKVDQDYEKIKSDLNSDTVTIDQQFVNFSGRWFSNIQEGDDRVRVKIKDLKLNF